MRNSSYLLGLDIGSVSLNTLLLDPGFRVTEEYYDYIHGKPFHVLYNRLKSILAGLEPGLPVHLALTGTGARLASGLIGGMVINEVIAQAEAVSQLYPQARTIIEMGGEDSKLILLDRPEGSDRPRMTDFEMNSVCAAGTGSFLDQQAKRIGLSIEKEFGEMALLCADPPRIAGRCSVFAKSDMIHLQQVATPLHDIVAGLCFALARNFKSTIGHGKEFRKPVVFSGGVASNKGMVRAFREILQLTPEELIIPRHHASMGAIGAAMQAVRDKESHYLGGLERLKEYIEKGEGKFAVLPRLKESLTPVKKPVQYNLNGQEKVKVYLGLDIGSLSTNIVLITEDHKVLERRYLPTAGKPIEAIQRGLTEIYEAVGSRVVVAGAGSTGSGRYLTGDFIGADVIINEITAQATAAIDYDPTVDTIFEIGGQDSKYISIRNGMVVDFEMNKVCAAGTGSFLEEQAEKLNINIIEQFGKLALDCDCPAKLGDRCTVFMESDLNSHQQKGIKVDSLVGGLAYSIVNNYLQKVVGPRKIGKHVFFQGGVANNKSVLAAFEQVLGHSITVPPNFDVTGAIGAAILAKRNLNGTSESRFKGFGMKDVPFTSEKFNCQGCANQCEIRKVRIEGESKALYYGGRCEKYETAGRRNDTKHIPDLFRRRLELLQKGYNPEPGRNRISIGIPRALMIYYQQFPFWHTFFSELGFDVLVSRNTDQKLVTRSLETINAELCLPVELMHGHVADLLQQGADYVFLPFLVDARKSAENPTSNCNCPWIQSHSFMVKAALRSGYQTEKILSPALHFRYFETVFKQELSSFIRSAFGISPSQTSGALTKADEAQKAFEKDLIEEGRKVIRNIPGDCIPVVLLGRPYNTGDPFLNLGVVEKLIRHKLMPIPADFLELNIAEIFSNYRSMYWPNGQKILAASRIIANNPGLYGIYITNFRCGPDSFLMHYVDEELKAKPCLHLEVDEHSADAGMITRIEAFVESIKGYEKNRIDEQKIFRPRKSSLSPLKGRILYFPYMNDDAHAISAAARSCGIPSEVLPMQDERDLELGRLYTSSRECFPMICTTGSFLRKLMEPGVDPARVSFFMPDHNGPCRFGQYNHFQRVIFDKLGFEKAEIFSPSNDSSYAELAGKAAPKFRFNSWRGFVSVDFIRKLKQETRPYELNKGQTEIIYQEALKRIIHCVENGAHGMHYVLKEIITSFRSIPVNRVTRKPIVAVLGEIFMRDNNFCNGRLVERLENLGVETMIAPFSEWITYSTYRYKRDSKWKGDYKGQIKSSVQGFMQQASESLILRGFHNSIDSSKIADLRDLLRLCSPYVHRDYDGDPPLAMGMASFLYNKGISGIAAILPFTCMPGTLIAALSDSFRKDHNNIPWINIAYDGQDSVSLETRLQAFVHQIKEFEAERKFANSGMSMQTFAKTFA